MVRYRRNFVPGASYFFTVTLIDRRASLLVDHIGSLRQAFRTTLRERPFTLDAIVVLPEHLHTVMTLPPDDHDFSGRWRRIKGLFTRLVVSAGERPLVDSRGEHAVWQWRFWEHTIRGDRDFETHVDYIHFNPVKHRHVSRVRDWPYSSFHQYVRQGVLEEDWAGDVNEGTMNFGERAS